MTDLSVAIIGTGNIAGNYDRDRLNGDNGIYSHAGAYAASGKFLLRTVFDTNCQRAEAFRDYWKADTAVSKIEDIYQGFHDVVSICTPDGTHFEIVRALLESRCCRTIFVEKPVALSTTETEQLEQLANTTDIEVIVNFQRRNEAKHHDIRKRLVAAPDKILSVGAYYIKGLMHIGITMIDTLTFLFGYPEAVLAYNRVFNREASDYSYEFVLFYDSFSVSVKTIDAERHKYNYHIFEIDMLLTDRRITLMDNSRAIRESSLTEYAYPGVRVLNDRLPTFSDTWLSQAMVDAVEYVCKVATSEVVHATNTLAASYNDALIVEQIIESFEKEGAKLEFEQGLWKK